MKHLLCAQSTKANDQFTIANGTEEQELIGRAAACVLDLLENEQYDLCAPCILCGGGNNGADGFALASLLAKAEHPVKVVYLGKLYAAPEQKKKKKNEPEQPAIDPEKIGTPELEAMSPACLARYEQAVADGIEIATELDEQAYTTFVDAVIGTGMHGALTDARVIAAFDRINALSTPVVAIDMPSGICSDTGKADAHALCANATVTMQSLKTGLVLFPGALYAGKLTLADIGIESDPTTKPHALVLEEQDAEALLPARPTRSCKGTFGRVLVVCGSVGMAGAAYLAAKGAYRAGAGLVQILTPAQNRVVLQQLIPEAIVTGYVGKKGLAKTVKAALSKADAVVLGCGIGQDKLSVKLVKTVLKDAKVPCVVDADALNIIANKPALLKGVRKANKTNVIITPHAAEAARLLGGKQTADSVLACVYDSANALYEKYGVNVVLKDERTLTRTTEGEYFVNQSGCDALATAGSGDVLAGVIGGLCAPNTKKATVGQTAALGVYLHGKAGEKAAEAVGARAAMAEDILGGLTK